jgi:mitogen-activated protein kinase 15
MKQNNEKDTVEVLEDHIIKRFSIHKKVGKGAYGVVFKATDKKTKEIVALKKLYGAFRDSTDSQRTFREVMLLQELNGHDNIIRLLNVINAQNDIDLYLIFEFMESDLYNVIRAGILKDVHKRYIVHQILKALKFIHSADIIHRDLKPSNIFINSDCHIKIGDFGLARTLSGNNRYQAIITDYVATRWYRAPEMIMNSSKYTKPIDMWSVGCILAELITGRPLFPGKSTKDMLKCVLEVTGIPDMKDFEDIRSKYDIQFGEEVFPDKISKKSLKSILAGAPPDAIDMVSRLLLFHPDKRLTVEQALEHQYVANFHKIEDEIISNKKITMLLDDAKKFSVEQYRSKLYEEIRRRKKEIRKQILELLNKK